MGLMLLPACSSRLPLNQFKRVDVDSNRRLGAPAYQVAKLMKSEASRMLSHVEISKMSGVLALNSPDDYSHISGNRRLEFLSTINIFCLD